MAAEHIQIMHDAKCKYCVHYPKKKIVRGKYVIRECKVNTAWLVTPKSKACPKFEI